MPYKDAAVRREKHKHYSKKWYLQNRIKQIQKSQDQKNRIRVLWIEYKAKQRCSHCGMQHPAVIDFHHIIKENKKSVNELIKKRSSLRAAIREAEEKCIPLCSNCHRILHWQETRVAMRKRRKKWASRKTS